jgi:hypothetical protein
MRLWARRKGELKARLRLRRSAFARKLDEWSTCHAGPSRRRGSTWHAWCPRLKSVIGRPCQVDRSSFKIDFVSRLTLKQRGLEIRQDAEFLIGQSQTLLAVVDTSDG